MNPEPSIINNDGDMYHALHVLAQEVGILGIFSDWPATVTYYAFVESDRSNKTLTIYYLNIP